MAYNAGSARLRKALRKVRDLPPDLRLDALPLQPSVDYARRVLAARDLYRWLFGPDLESL